MNIHAVTHVATFWVRVLRGGASNGQALNLKGACHAEKTILATLIGSTLLASTASFADPYYRHGNGYGRGYGHREVVVTALLPTGRAADRGAPLLPAPPGHSGAASGGATPGARIRR